MLGGAAKPENFAAPRWFLWVLLFSRCLIAAVDGGQRLLVPNR
jgi:hypothetical protein